jgi:tetratricopeptide (TPR) repeat protein
MNGSSMLANPKFRQYLEHLRKLHQLIRMGRDESAEGEHIRDLMDAPASELTDTEIKELQGISADLYSLGVEQNEFVRKHTKQSRLLFRDALAARNQGEQLKAIALLRQCRPYLEQKTLAYLRGTLWASAGEYALSVDFYKQAMSRDPADAKIRYLWLDAISRVDPGFSRTEADNILEAHRLQPPEIVQKALDILLSHSADHGRAAGAVPFDLQSILLETVERLKTVGKPLLAAAALAQLAFLYEEQGNLDSAVNAFSDAITLAPEYDALYTGRGMVLYGTNTLAAVLDFRKAVELGSTLVWPYFMLAHSGMLNGDYQTCLGFARQARTLTDNLPLLAHLHEWIAISMASLGEEQPAVLAEFQRALDSSSNNARILRNRETYLKFTRDQQVVNLNWQEESPIELRRFGASLFRRELASAQFVAA